MTQSQSPPWNRAFLAALVILCPLVAAAIYMASRPDRPLPQAEARSPAVPRNQIVDVGGVPRPASDVAPRRRGANASADGQEKNTMTPFHRGRIQRLKPDANPAVASAYEAATSGQYPERMSPMVIPKPFSQVAYERDPESYLSIHEPGRVWQSAQPGPGVAVLERISRREQLLKQGESVRLSVKTLAKMPVTFASFDHGTFVNGLTVITVAADESGIAEAAFHGSSGVVGQVNILAASPVATERVHFTVYVVPAAATAATVARSSP